MPAIDEESPKKKKTGYEIGEDLSPLSVSDLEERIILLDVEINRIEEAIRVKQASAATAASFFKR